MLADVTPTSDNGSVVIKPHLLEFTFKTSLFGPTQGKGELH